VIKDLVFEKQMLESQQRQAKNMATGDTPIKKIPKVVDKSQEYMFSPEKGT
jgi:hypothetical protein